MPLASIGKRCSKKTPASVGREPHDFAKIDYASTVRANERLPREVTPTGYPASSPNIVFEVRSPHDRWSEIYEKSAEYLNAGVELVCVLVPESQQAHVFYPDRPGGILEGDEELSLPAPLNDSRTPVSASFAGS